MNGIDAATTTKIEFMTFDLPTSGVAVTDVGMETTLEQDSVYHTPTACTANGDLLCRHAVLADSAYVRIPNTSKKNCRPSWFTPSVVRPEMKSSCVSVNASRSNDQYRTRPTVPRQYRIAVTTATGVEK